MRRTRKLPATAVLIVLAEQGLTNREIGEMFGTTRQAVERRLHGVEIDRPARVQCPECKGLGTVSVIYGDRS